MIVHGIPEDKQFDWKDELLKDGECDEDYECVYCWKKKPEEVKDDHR